MTPRRTLLMLLLIASFVLLSGGVAVAAQEPLVVRDTSMAEFPRVTLQVGLPASMLSDSGAKPVFSVKENGRSTEILSTSQPQIEPVDVVLVVDTSGSMKGSSLGAAKGAARAFIDELLPGSKVGVISFADRPHLVGALGTGKAALTSEISHLSAVGETAMYDALIMAAGEASRAGAHRPVIVLLSDGGDTVSRASADASVKALVRIQTPVLVVALPSAESDFSILRSIAKQTGGRFATVSAASQLVSFYTGLAKELQTTWDVTFVSHRPSTKDLDVVVAATIGQRTSSGSSLLPNPLYESAPVDTTPVLPSAPANLVTLAWAIGLLFAAAFAFIVSVGLMAVKPRTGLDQLHYYDQMTATGESEDAEDHSNLVTSSVLGAVDYVAGKRGLKRLAYEQLERAGLPLRPIEYITLHMLAVICVGIVAEIVSGNIGIAILAVIVATIAPLAYLDHRISKRKEAFETQLPDVLSLIAGALRAGWGLQQALDLVVEQTEPPVSSEFARAVTEVRLGRSVEQALDNVAKRMESDDFTWAATAIGIQRDVGGNLAEVLDVVAATIRDRGALKRQLSALTAEGRLSAIILYVLPFFLVLILSFANPTYLSMLVTTGPGLIMCGVGTGLLIAGAIWLRRVVEIEV